MKASPSNHRTTAFQKTITQLITLYILLSLIVGSSACTRKGPADSNPKLMRDIRTDLLGTAIMISTYEEISSQEFDGAFAVVAEIDAKMSVNNPNRDRKSTRLNSSH